MFEKILKAFGLTKKSFSTGGGSILNMLRSGAERSDLDYYEGWIYACVNKIAEGFAQIDWELYQMKGKEVVEVEEHALLSLLNRFNPKYTRFDSLQLMAIYYKLFGHCPLLMMFDGTKKAPSELWVVPPQYLSVATKDEEGYPLTYRYTVGGKTQTIDASRILDIRNPDPASPDKAFGIIKPIRPVADGDYYAKLWNKTLLLNQAQPTGVITVPNGIEDAEAKALRAMIEETYAGFENAHKIAILKNGATLTPFSLSPTDMDFSNLRDKNQQEICAMFGVPKILLGLDSGYNRATAETAEMVFAKYTLKPMLTKIIEQMNEFLVPLFGANLWLDFENPVPTDKEFELKEKEIGWNKWLTTNEIRRDEGRPELSGGDVIYGSIVSVPMIGVGGTKSEHNHEHFQMKLENPRKGVAYVKQIKIMKKVMSRDYRLKQYGVDIADRVEQKMLFKSGGIKFKLLIKTDEGAKKKAKEVNFTAEQKLEWWEKTIERKRKVEGQWKSKMIGLFDKQKAEILANIEASDDFKGLKTKATKQKIDDLLFDYDEQVKTTISVIKPEYYNSLIAGAELASNLIGEEPINILSIPKCVEWLNKVADKYGEDMVDTTRADVSRIFETALSEGQSNYQVQEQISSYFDNIGTYRAEMISRTESARSLTASQGFTWQEYGFKSVEWYAEPTACEVCQGLALDSWTVKDAQSGTIEYSHPNCECRFLPLE